MLCNRLIILLIFLLFADANCIAQSKSSESSFEGRTISYVNKAKSYIAANKKSTKIDTDVPVRSIQVERYDKKETIKEIWILYYNTNDSLYLTFNKSGKITNMQLYYVHPNFAVFIKKHDFKHMLSWNVIFEKYLTESIKFIKEKKIDFNYKTSSIYLYIEAEDKREHRIKYGMLLTDDEKKLVLHLNFDANMKVEKYRIKKNTRPTDDENLTFKQPDSRIICTAFK